ncbi:amidase [Actinomadura rubrisoli]|nr:amidase [Actinomadura rubrisoli]
MIGQNDTAPWAWSATEIVRKVSDGTATCSEITRSCLDRVHAVNPELRAVVEVDEDGAMAAAAAVDERARRGAPLGPLAGVPMVTKVNVDQRGSATTNGVTAFRDRIAEHDNPVIANLRHADAIILGRSSTPAFSWRWFTDSELYGATLNPWNPARTVGGSSGGSAAAVAAGMVPLAHGSDLAGSIRYPAMACGLFGLRPSQGRVPSYDASAPAERAPFAQLLGSQGPMARSVADLRCALRAMERYSDLDPWTVPHAGRADDSTVPCRVAVVRDVPWADVDPAVSAQVDLAAGRLKAAGYDLVDAVPPGFESTLDIYRGLLWEAGHGLLNTIDRHGDDASRAVAEVFRGMVADLDVADYFGLFGRRTSMARDWQVFLDEHPLVLMPVSWQQPFPAGYDQRGADAVRRVMASMVPAIAVNLCGLPAVTAPTAFNADGPLGVQIVGRRFRDGQCLAAAEAVAGDTAPIAPVVLTGTR